MKTKKNKAIHQKTRYTSYFRVFIKTVLWFFASVIVFFILYGIIAFFTSRVTIAGKREKGKKVFIHLMQSGVHTDFLVPVKNDEIDWTKVFPRKNTKLNDTNTRYLAIGWGDKNFYMNTPEWSDLTLKTAVFCMTGLGTAAVHSTYYYEVPKDKPTIQLSLSKKQYRKLIQYVKNTLVLTKTQKSVYIKPYNIKVVSGNDAYYEAHLRYSLFHTCNTWINNGLKACQKKACLWTPTSGGIFYQYGK
jgi:uncharacterized protein (TIGR02117 family)